MSASNSRSRPSSPVTQPDIERNLPHERSVSPSPSLSDLSHSDVEDPDSPIQPQRNRKPRRTNNVPRHGEDMDRQLAEPDGAREVDRRQSQQQQGEVAQGGEKEDDPLKLRLDLNLDVDIQVRASVHGDVTLSMLR